MSLTTSVCPFRDWSKNNMRPILFVFTITDLGVFEYLVFDQRGFEPLRIGNRAFFQMYNHVYSMF